MKIIRRVFAIEKKVTKENTDAGVEDNGTGGHAI